jgi:hypothetical protein
MTEHAEDPVGHASSKIVQYVSLVTMAAEALAQRSQQRAAAAAVTDQKATAALRAQHNAARGAARLQWLPVLDARRGADTSLGDAGLAWASSQVWRDVDPEAALAADRALERMRQLRPDVMARFDRLTGDGLDQVEAMRRVAVFFDRPAAHPHAGAAREKLTVHQDAAPPPATTPTTRTSTSSSSSVGAARPNADETGALHQVETPPVRARHHRDDPADVVLVASDRTPPQLAHDGYPERLTGQVLAAGKVKPKTPDRTAPAAVRSVGLATAARATGGRSR